MNEIRPRLMAPYLRVATGSTSEWQGVAGSRRHRTVYCGHWIYMQETFVRHTHGTAIRRGRYGFNIPDCHARYHLRLHRHLPSESSQAEGSSKLINTLREQLMRDNSDFSHEISKETIKVHMRADPELDELREKNTEHNNYYVTKINQQTNNEENSKMKDTAEENGSKKKPENPVSEKDLFYYVDDEKLISKKPEDRKYKTIKVRHQYRRSGQSQYIQEEAEGGVAIVSLSKAPFPELRLPRSRRQYKHDHGAAITDDEDVPPPPVDDNRPAGEGVAVKASDHCTGDQEDTVGVGRSSATVVQRDDESQLSLSF